MELNHYQKLSQEYDQNPNRKILTSYIIPLFGIMGECGALVSEFKKKLRDKQAHLKFEEHIEEILGNILWYVSNVATKYDFELETIASKNLEKIKERFPTQDSVICVTEAFDNNFIESEQIPRKFEVLFNEELEGERKKILILIDGKQVGNELTDNSYEDDGYRYHDVFHFGFAAVLGWSPVIRSIMKRKRKSIPQIDEVEDGARAIIIEEAISAFIYQEAKDHMYYEDVTKVDHDILKTIKNLISHLEVSKCTMAEWERAIFMGYETFRLLTKNNGGKVLVDLNNREIKYLGN